MKLLLAFSGAFALVAIVLPQRFSDPAVLAGIVGAIFPVWLTQGFDRVMQFVQGHARTVFFVGVLILIGTGVGAAVRIDWCVSRGIDPCISGNNPYPAAIMSMMAFGIALAVLSRRA